MASRLRRRIPAILSGRGSVSCVASTGAVGVGVTPTLEWTIPDTPYSVPGTFYAQTAGQTYDVSQHVADLANIGVYSITAQSKNGVAGSYGFTVNQDTGLISVPSNLENPASTDSYAVSVSLSSGPDADFQRRILESNAIWYQGFTSEAEVLKFATPSGTYPPPEPESWRRWVPNQIGSSGALEYFAPVNRYNNLGWWRPFNALPADSNYGLPQDRRYTGGPNIPTTWGTFGSPNGWNRWDYGCYGHTDYHAADGKWDGDEFYLQFRVWYDPLELAFWQELGGGDFSGNTKLSFINFIGGGGSCNQSIILSGPHRAFWTTNYGNSTNSSPNDYQGGGDATYWRTQADAYRARRGLPALTDPQWSANSYNPGSNYASTCYYAHTSTTTWCPRYEIGGWTTVLFRVKGGHRATEFDTTGGLRDHEKPNMNSPTNDAARDTTVEIWLSTQADINSGNGYTLTTGKIYSKSDLMFCAGTNSGELTKLMWNAFHPMIYDNGQVFTGGDRYRRFTQIIFSDQFIPCPQPGC